RCLPDSHCFLAEADLGTRWSPGLLAMGDRGWRSNGKLWRGLEAGTSRARVSGIPAPRGRVLPQQGIRGHESMIRPPNSRLGGPWMAVEWQAVAGGRCAHITGACFGPTGTKRPRTTTARHSRPRIVDSTTKFTPWRSLRRPWFFVKAAKIVRILPSLRCGAAE